MRTKIQRLPFQFVTIPMVSALLVLGATPAAHAFEITGLSIAPNAGNTANAQSTTGNNLSIIRSSTAISSSSPGPVPDVLGSMVSFNTRYAALLVADREATSNSLTQTQTSDYRITFTVVDPFNLGYTLQIDTQRKGALTNVDDSAATTMPASPGAASATLAGVTGKLNSTTNTNLGTTGVSIASTVDFNFPFDHSNQLITSFSGTQTFTLDFSWTASATSQRDEAAVRLGFDATLSGTTAGTYPGAGNRTAANDGHFVMVTATLLSSPAPVPEPGTLLLIGSGLVGIGVGARRNRRKS